MEVATKSFHNQCCLKFLWFCGAFVPFTSLYLLISLQCFLANLVVDRRVGTVLVPEPFVNAQLLHIFPINHVYLRIIKMMMNVLRLSTSISMLKSPKSATDDCRRRPAAFTRGKAKSFNVRRIRRNGQVVNVHLGCGK